MKTWLIVVVILSGIVGFSWLEWQPWLNQTPQQGQLAEPVATTLAVGVVRHEASGAEQLSVAANRDSGKREIRAKLSPVDFAILASEIDAKVSALPFKEGQSFGVGDILISLDCDLHRAKLERVEAELEIAERNAQANVRLVQRGSVSRLEADNSLSERDRMQAQVRELSIQVSKCEVRAPYAGKVVESKVRQEQFVQVGQPLMEILDDSRLEFEFIVPSDWMSWVSIGFPFEVRVQETRRTYPARIERIGARIDAVSQTIRIVGAIDGRYNELVPGMSGVVAIDAPPTRPEDGS